MAFKGVLPAPRVTAAPYGLFSAAEVVERGPRDEHWGRGFEALSEICSFSAAIHDICGAVEPVSVFDGSEATRWRSVLPFGIVVTDDGCSTIGLAKDDRRARVVRQLDLVTEKAVETELYQGLYRREYDNFVSETSDAYLSSSTATVVADSTGGFSPLQGLAILEQAYAASSPGVPGVLHLTPLLAVALKRQLIRADGKLYTITGSRVAIGSGYDGRGPGDTSSPSSLVQHWMYMSGPTYVVLGAKELITINEAMSVNPADNSTVFAAERPAAVYVDGCGQYAIKVDITA